jgi:hypothetical protein
MKFVSALKSRSALIGAALLAVFVPVVSFAQDSGGTTLDTSQITADIAAGVAAVAVIGAAWVGFKYLKRVWNKI